jgi:hypothetical protein
MELDLRDLRAVACGPITASSAEHGVIMRPPSLPKRVEPSAVTDGLTVLRVPSPGDFSDIRT